MSISDQSIRFVSGERKIADVVIVLIPGFALMSYASAVEPLRAANQLAGQELYRWRHVTPGNQPAVASNGATVLPDDEFGSDAYNVDLILVCAGGNPTIFNDRRTFGWLRRLARKGVMIGGISGGPFLLAKAGLLDGYKCTIHWEHLPAFKETFPHIDVLPSLFVADGNRLTCSGGIAGLDMMVSLISDDHGHELAAAVGDWFLHTHLREGPGPQRMDLRFRVGVADEKVLRAVKLMEANIETPLDRSAIATDVGLSLRQLERSFRTQLGRGVHEHYLKLRLGRARQLVRESSLPILDVAIASGFTSASHFSRAFREAFGMAPSLLRIGHRRAEP